MLVAPGLPAERTFFDVAAASADRSLVDFARQAHLSVLFPTGGVSQIRTNEVRGEYDVEQALQLLLRDTGLTAGVTDAGSLIVRFSNNEGVTGVTNNKHRNWVVALFATLLGGTAVQSAHAQAVEAAATLDEVVITAQKRTERLQDVPVSAAVLSADTIGKLNAGDISDLNRLVPSVNLNGTINGRVPMGMRGISTVQSEFNIGLASGVAVMIDGVPVPSDSRAGNALEDIQSVEVLKGPQATLGGRAAAQGVINMVTRKPSDTFTGNLSSIITSDGEYRLNGYVAGPISGKVDYSVAGYYTQRTFPITNTHLKKDTKEDVYGLRGKLLFKPNENLDITLAARLGKDNSTGFNFVYTYVPPGGCLLIGACPPPGTPGFPLTFLQQPSLLPGITPSFSNLKYSSPIDAFSDVKDTDYSLDLQYRIGNLTFGSTTAYQKEDQTNVQDLFAVDNFFWNLLSGAPGSGAPPFDNTQTQFITSRQISQEFKLASATDQPFSYLVGAFYSDNKVSLNFLRGLLPAFDNYYAESDTKTTALYGRTTWKFTPQNALVTGLRYNSDKISYTYRQDNYTASFPPPVIYFNLGANDSNSESTMVGDVSLQHFYSGDVMTYATYARGYAPAVFNLAEPLTPTAPKVSRAKKTAIDNIEIGTKGTYLDKRLTLNAALFFTKYKDFQVQAVVPNGSINPPSKLVNAGAETKGLEVDLAAALTRNFKLTLNAAYIEATLKNFKNAPCYGPDSPTSPPVANCVGGIQDVSGKPMPNAPKLKFALGLEQRIPTGDGSDFVLAANYAYRDAAQMLANQNPHALMPSSGILNLSAGFHAAGGKTSVTLFVNNVTDKVYYTDLEDFWSGPWQSNAVVGQPARDAKRYAGVRFNHSF
jgi:iron complex outermembrane recepter protein